MKTSIESSWDRNEYKRTWRDGQYLDKFSWKGHLRGMQLFSRKSDILTHAETIWVPDNQVNSSYSTDLGSLLNQNEKIVDPCSVSGMIFFIFYGTSGRTSSPTSGCTSGGTLGQFFYFRFWDPRVENKQYT